jgi:hypothetical protein
MSSGCAQDLPIEIYLDSSFSEVERQAVLDAMDEWNEALSDRLPDGGPAFVHVGYIDDDWEMADYEDGLHVVYRLDGPTPEEQWLQYQDNGKPWGTIGYCSDQDCTLFLYFFDGYMRCNEPGYRLLLANDGCRGECADEYLDRKRYNYTRSLAVHELGHMLVVAHFDFREGIMNTTGLSFDEPLQHVTEADVGAVCEIDQYDCR